jgi:hypothetical protein
MAPSASLSRVQMFMLTTTATISTIAASSKIGGQSVVILLEGLGDRGVGGASERFGVLQRGPLGVTEQLGLPPGSEKFDLRLRYPDVPGGAVVDGQAIGAAIDLGDAQTQQLRQFTVECQLRGVPERGSAGVRKRHECFVGS